MPVEFQNHSKAIQLAIIMYMHRYNKSFSCQLNFKESSGSLIFSYNITRMLYEEIMFDVKLNNHGYPAWYALICGPVEKHTNLFFVCFLAYFFMWASAQTSHRHSVSSLLPVTTTPFQTDGATMCWRQVTANQTIIPIMCAAERVPVTPREAYDF